MKTNLYLKATYLILSLCSLVGCNGFQASKVANGPLPQELAVSGDLISKFTADNAGLMATSAIQSVPSNACSKAVTIELKSNSGGAEILRG